MAWIFLVEKLVTEKLSSPNSISVQQEPESACIGQNLCSIINQNQTKEVDEKKKTWLFADPPLPKMQ